MPIFDPKPDIDIPEMETRGERVRAALSHVQREADTRDLIAVMIALADAERLCTSLLIGLDLCERRGYLAQGCQSARFHLNPKLDPPGSRRGKEPSNGPSRRRHRRGQ